jgi:hypothetical protein
MTVAYGQFGVPPPAEFTGVFGSGLVDGQRRVVAATFQRLNVDTLNANSISSAGTMTIPALNVSGALSVTSITSPANLTISTVGGLVDFTGSTIVNANITPSAGPNDLVYINEPPVITTNATPTTVLSFVFPTVSSVLAATFTMQFTMSGADQTSGTASIGLVRQYKIKVNSSGVAVINAIELHDSIDNTLSAIAVNVIQPVAGSLAIQATGIVGKTIAWVCKATLIRSPFQ